MFSFRRVGLPAAAAIGVAVALAVIVTLADAEGIDAGLWQISTTIVTGGMTGPPRQSAKCLTAEQVRDLPTTFSPVPTMINSDCAPIERKFDGQKLNFHLVCKGQLNVELTGAFNFDNPHHYTGTVQTKASIGGQQIPDSQQSLEAQWVSACPQSQ